MDDTPFCPICCHKLKVSDSAGLNHLIKNCKKSVLHHAFQLIYDKKTELVTGVYFSLPGVISSRFILIDFVKGTSRISCYKNGEAHHIDLERILQPDFPSLTNLKEAVSTLVLFS